MFEAFRKGSDTRGEGLGLGLALVKRIATAHKGSAFAVNREGGGATVGLRLPA
jgi:two-component system sensor histidine kinase MprB